MLSKNNFPPPRWWEKASAITRPYLKAHGKTPKDLMDDLDHLNQSVIDVLEIFAPCHGGICYHGLDTLVNLSRLTQPSHYHSTLMDMEFLPYTNH